MKIGDNDTQDNQRLERQTLDDRDAFLNGLHSIIRLSQSQEVKLGLKSAAAASNDGANKNLFVKRKDVVD